MLILGLFHGFFNHLPSIKVLWRKYQIKRVLLFVIIIILLTCFYLLESYHNNHKNVILINCIYNFIIYKYAFDYTFGEFVCALFWCGPIPLSASRPLKHSSILLSTISSIKCGCVNENRAFVIYRMPTPPTSKA